VPDAGLVYACITHVPLWVEPPPWVLPIYLGEAQGEGRLNLRDLAPDWVPHHPRIGGTAGSFALRRYIEQHHPRAQRVGLCQYRKFVSRRRVSRVADAKYPLMDLVRKDETSTEQLAQWMDPGDAQFVVCGAYSLSNWRKRSSYLEQYERVHHAEDLLRFAAQAVELGVLGAREADAFLSEDFFIPGGLDLGVYPAEFWLRGTAEIEAVTRTCVERYPVRREGYQARAWSFCIERLGSYLLLRHFRGGASRRTDRWTRWRWTRRYVGRMNLILEGGDGAYTVGT
jgi:hypothetical protein